MLSSKHNSHHYIQQISLFTVKLPSEEEVSKVIEPAPKILTTSFCITMPAVCDNAGIALARFSEILEYAVSVRFT